MWLYIPSQSAPASAGSSLDSKSPRLARSARSCTVRGNCPSPKGLHRSLKRGRFPRLRSGLTSKPSAMQASVESWAKSMQSSADTPVSHFPSPVKDLAETILATYGRGLLTALTHINRRSASSRMSQGTFGWDSEPSDEISKTEAISFRRAYSRRLKLARRTSDSGCSSWPSPIVPSGGRTLPEDCSRPTDCTAYLPDGTKRQLDLPNAVRFWGSPQTPRDVDHGVQLANQADCWMTPHGMAGTDHTGKPGAGGEFAKQATQWKTPNVPNRGAELDKSHRPENFQPGPPDPETPTDGDTSSNDGPSSRPLWPPPAANDDNKTPEAHLAMKKRMGERDGTGANRTAITSLNVATKAWQTPRACDKGPPGESNRHQGQPKGKRLNPLFVNWLMGWPIGWAGSTHFGPAETESFLCAQRRLLCSYLRKLL